MPLALVGKHESASQCVPTMVSKTGIVQGQNMSAGYSGVEREGEHYDYACLLGLEEQKEKTKITPASISTSKENPDRPLLLQQML